VKRFLFIFGIWLMILPAAAQYKVNRVVIDAGHGGHDPGASGKHSVEKDIALSIALKTGNYIKEYLPDVEVIYTRSDDRFIELHRRAMIANEKKADLFISIHCNANSSSLPYGAETYVMGLHKSAENLEVAKLENAAILQEENYKDMYEGFDPNQDEDYITLTMFQNAFLEQSTIFADKVQDQFRERVKLTDRGVKQAGFLVLYKIAMPGVLIETGFLSNSKDEAFLASEDGQVYIASAIYRAFKEYKEEVERSDNKAEIYKPQEPPVITQKPAPVIYYRVQVASFPTSIPSNYNKLKGLKDVREYYHDGKYKYTEGNYKSLDEAITRQNQLKKDKKYKDAFVVAFDGDKRISIQEAEELLKN
jgi:N-acetylmuramoyl-L-alanine amidase